MAMTGVASRFAFFDLEFAISISISHQSVTNGENEQPGETTNPHYVRGSNSFKLSISPFDFGYQKHEKTIL